MSKDINTVVSRQRAIAFKLMLPTCIVLLLLSIYPLFSSLNMAFRLEPLYNPDVARYVGFRNFTDLWSDDRVRESVLRTLGWAISLVFIQLILGFLLAILLDRKMRGAGILRSLIIIPVFISPVAMGLTWRHIFEPVSGLANWVINSGLGLEKLTWLSHKDTALYTLMLVDTWQWTPFVALILLAGMQSISAEITEAAKLDKITGFSYYTRIVIPLIRPVIIVVILLRLVDSIRAFDLNYIMTKGGPGSSTLLSSTHAYTMFTYGSLGLMAAYGFLILILINIVVGLCLKTFSKAEQQVRKEGSI